MQRLRKEIQKRIDEIHLYIEAEEGFGYDPFTVGAYTERLDEAYDTISDLERQFAATYGLTPDELFDKQAANDPLLRVVYGGAR